MIISRIASVIAWALGLVVFISHDGSPGAFVGGIVLMGIGYVLWAGADAPGSPPSHDQ